MLYAALMLIWKYFLCLSRSAFHHIHSYLLHQIGRGQHHVWPMLVVFELLFSCLGTLRFKIRVKASVPINSIISVKPLFAVGLLFVSFSRALCQSISENQFAEDICNLPHLLHIHQRKSEPPTSGLRVTLKVAHNPEVGGSNPSPATI